MFCVVPMFLNTVLSGFSIILLGKRQLVVDFLLSSEFYVGVTVICLALMVP